jgi:hypothetical protein
MSLEPTAPRPAPAFMADEERPITVRPFLVPQYVPHFKARSPHKGPSDKPLPASMERVYGEGSLNAGGSCKSSPQAESRVCTPSRLMQLRKKRKKHNKQPVWRPSTGASGLPSRRSGGSRWHPSQIRRTWLPPQKLSSPSQSLYMDMGMVMIREKGVPREGAMRGSLRSLSATKSIAVAVWLGL